MSYLIETVGLKITQYSKDANQYIHGLQLSTVAGDEFKKSKRKSQWQWMRIPKGERLIGFHGTIFNNERILQLGLVTLTRSGQYGVTAKEPEFPKI